MDEKRIEQLKQASAEMPIFAGMSDRSGIRWDVPASQLSQDMKNPVMEFARNEQHRPLLAQAAYAYKDDSFIADQVAPFYTNGITSMIGQYRKFNERTFYDRPETETAKDAPPGRINFGSALEDYDLTGRALSIFLSKADEGQAITQYGSVAQWRNIATMMLTKLLLLDREITVADLYQTAGNYAAGFTATASPLWSDAAATLLEDVATGEDALYTEADTYVLGYDVYRQLQRHPAITGATTVTGPRRSQLRPMVTVEGINAYFEVPIIVGKARYNSTPQADTVTMTRIWQNNLTIAHLKTDPGGPDMSAPFVRTFLLNNSSLPNYNGFSVKTVQTNASLLGGEMLMVGYFSQEKVYADKSGYKLECL